MNIGYSWHTLDDVRDENTKERMMVDKGSIDSGACTLLGMVFIRNDDKNRCWLCTSEEVHILMVLDEKALELVKREALEINVIFSTHISATILCEIHQRQYKYFCGISFILNPSA